MLLTTNTFNYDTRENLNNNINENINVNESNNFENKSNALFNMSNGTYINDSRNKNINNNNEESLQVECICDNKDYTSKNELIQCFLCQKYQHLSCIYHAQYISPYICFNCQFQNNHFYLRWKKTILPAREFIYKKKWEDDTSQLKDGTKKFEFYLNLNELYSLYNNDKLNPNSHYLALLCLTNNGKPFHLGFPDNVNIQINGKQFYFTEGKGFKRPLLLSLDNTTFYTPKKKHLITSEKYDIPKAADFFITPKNSFSSHEKYTQKVVISFTNPLENYRGSEFEFVDVRHYIFYIGVFQEIKIPQSQILRSCDDLNQYYDIFKNLYKEKVLKLKWSKVSNFITLGNEELNMNLISNVSNQKIINPIRGLFCQHSDVLDYGECCGYITSNSQVYKCFKCNKPLNIMYIDDASEKMFNRHRNENYSQIYYSTKFKFIRGEIMNDNKDKTSKSNSNKNQNDVNNEDDSLSDSFFDFHLQKQNEDFNDNYENENNEQNNINNENDIIELSSDESIVNEEQGQNMNSDNNNSNNNNNTDNIVNNISNSIINNISKSLFQSNEFQNINNNYINNEFQNFNYNNMNFNNNMNKINFNHFNNGYNNIMNYSNNYNNINEARIKYNSNMEMNMNMNINMGNSMSMVNNMSNFNNSSYFDEINDKKEEEVILLDDDEEEEETEK